MSDRICFYSVTAEYGELSNFAPYPITLRGKRWILWGGIFLAVGFVVSLIKGGQFRRLRRLLIGLHVWTRRTGAG